MVRNKDKNYHKFSNSCLRVKANNSSYPSCTSKQAARTRIIKYFELC